MKNLKLFLLGWMAVMALAQVGCSSEDRLSGTENTRKPLNVNIHSGLYTRGGVISGSYLPNASVVGLFLQKEDGTPYDNLPYNNIPYVATGTGASQTWAPQSGDKQIYLSSTDGKAYAYYPYNAENTSISSIHLDVSRQDDVMYCSTASTGLNDKNADASFELQHALAVMKVKVKKGSYTGAGVVTSCAISGSPIGLTGTLDGTTGNLSGVTPGKVSADKSYTISNTATDHDIIFVPTSTAGQVTVGLTMDGKEYTTTTTSSETFTSNQCYTLNLTVDDSGVTLSGIQVGDWTMNGEGNSIVTAGGYKITFEGDYSDIALNVNAEGGGSSVTVQAISISSSEVPPHYVTASNCSISQLVNENRRTITLTNLTGNVTLTFNGIGMTWAEVQSDGVYGIRTDGRPRPYSEAKTTSDPIVGVAIVMLGRITQISNSILTSGYGANDVDFSEIDNLKAVGGGVTVRPGYFPLPNGSYYDQSTSYRPTLDYTQWLNTPNTVLADTAGWSHTEVLIANQPSGANYLGPNTQAFRDGTSGVDNQGYSDWYVPAGGQLAYIFLHYDEINTLLKKSSGATLFTATSSDWFYSSSEFGSSGWLLSFEKGCLSTGMFKTDNGKVRFCRDITE